jgi:iron complex outermembrane receptor protein
VKLRPITLAIISTLTSTAVYAEQLETITVNADFRPAKLQETTSSITVITPVEIQKRSAQHLENILNLAPNVNSAGGASRTNHFQIRGIGERGEFENPINPSVGLTVDGIDYSRSGAAGTLFDVKQVEVLRGP